MRRGHSFVTMKLSNRRKGGFIITSGLELTYTPEMEKAMHQSHGVGYAEYARKLNQRLKVEKKREKSHKQSQEVVNEMDRQIHR
ncbi:hypothetical protein [Aquibacillus salsiterrae]|uniref:Uncharacterized protein n=1 Tax=Aquibacillus salsiterrae TaxID=2950439 RepID=A0A9X3WIW7_9BACI|nr:hypothetical protein [Aquibacillus salsiterrae]MDC3417886.1 hypothetical protein [Aquibacillus salsiterrae]